MSDPRRTAEMTRALREARRGGAAPIVDFLSGQVTAVVGSTVTITLGGSGVTIAGVRYLTSYSPAVNDIVEVRRRDTDLLVLGKYA